MFNFKKSRPIGEKALDVSQESRQLRRWDLTALGLSALCLVHCLGAPVVMLGFPALSLAANESLVHWVLALILLAIAGWAFYRGYQIHGRGHVPFWGTVGLALLFLALLAPGHQHLEHSHLLISLETALSVAGSLILIGAHLSNMKLCRHSCCCPAKSSLSPAKSGLRPEVCDPTNPSTQNLRSPQLG